MPPISSVPPQNPQLPGNQNNGDFFVPNTHFNPGQGADNPRGADAGATQGGDGAPSPDGPGQGGPGGAGHGDHDGPIGGHGGNGPGQGSGDHASIGNPGPGGPGGQHGGYDDGGHGGPSGGYQSGAASYGGAGGGLIHGVIADATHLLSTIASPLFGESSPFNNAPPASYGDSPRAPDHTPTYTTAPSPQVTPQPASLQEAPRPPIDPGRPDATPAGGRTAADATIAAQAQGSAAARGEPLDPRAAQANVGAQAAQAAAQTQAALLAQQAALMGAMASASLQLAQEPVATSATLAQTSGAVPEGRELATGSRPGVREDRDVRDPRTAQQAPADNRRTPSEILAQAFAKGAPEAQARGSLSDARAPDQRLIDAQTRTEAETKSLRDAADKARNAGASDAVRALPGGDQARRSGLFSAVGQGGIMAGASESMRQAMDWVGQQVREFGFGAQSGSEGVHAMRVIAGLIAASVVVLVAIAVLYALRVIFVV